MSKEPEPEDSDIGRPVKQPCCEAWAKAHEWGTDNEGYSALVHYVDGKAYIGTAIVHSNDGLPPVNGCPWCGAKKN